MLIRRVVSGFSCGFFHWFFFLWFFAFFAFCIWYSRAHSHLEVQPRSYTSVCAPGVVGVPLSSCCLLLRAVFASMFLIIREITNGEISVVWSFHAFASFTRHRLLGWCDLTGHKGRKEEEGVDVTHTLHPVQG